MSKSGKEAVILTKDSDFAKVVLPEGEYDIGQEIEVNIRKNGLMSKWILSAKGKLTAVAAMLLVAIMVPTIASMVMVNTTAYAYVTLDINPSTEFSVNSRDRIITARPLNREGSVLLEGAKLSGEEIEYGVEFFMVRAWELGYPAADGEGAVIATTVTEEEDKNLEQKVSETLQRTIQDNELPVNAEMLTATNQIRQEAEKEGISTGKYLIALQASEEQLDVDIEDVKNASIGTAIKNAGGDLKNILKEAHKTKEELSRLFENNKEKIRRRDNGGSNDNRGNGSGNNDKDNNNDSRRNDNERNVKGRQDSDRNENNADNDNRDNRGNKSDVRRDRNNDGHERDDHYKNNGSHKKSDNGRKNKGGWNNKGRENKGRNNSGNGKSNTKNSGRSK